MVIGAEWPLVGRDEESRALVDALRASRHVALGSRSDGEGRGGARQSVKDAAPLFRRAGAIGGALGLRPIRSQPEQGARGQARGQERAVAQAQSLHHRRPEKTDQRITTRSRARVPLRIASS